MSSHAKGPPSMRNLLLLLDVTCRDGCWCFTAGIVCSELLQVLNAQLAGYDVAIIYSLTSERLLVMEGTDGKWFFLLFIKVVQKLCHLNTLSASGVFLLASLLSNTSECRRPLQKRATKENLKKRKELWITGFKYSWKRRWRWRHKTELDGDKGSVAYVLVSATRH